DTVNHRWIEPRKGDWKLIGNAFSRNDALHTALYQAFCIDGMPTTVEGLVQRLKERGGRHGTTLTNHDK
ncbi:CNP1-like family protein, partial [Neisseria sp. P0001.S004]